MPARRTTLFNDYLRMLFVAALLMGSRQSFAIEWPQEISAPEGTIVVYQPQPESLKGNTLSARSAISLELKDGKDAIFGAMWFDARLETDQDAGTAQVVDIKVKKVGWPDSRDASEQRFTAIVESSVPENGFTISLERLSSSLKTAEIEQQSLEDLKAEPPQIEFSEELAVLLLYDGQPRFSEVEDSPYERALNTPFLVAHNRKSDRYYLGSGAFWYEARNAMGPWQATDSPPADLEQMVPEPDEEDQGAATKPPAVVVATAPTELIATDGKPNWESLTGGKLLYVSNTETAWLRQLSTGNQYVLLSGRWYRAKEQSGPWTFVPATELPESFKDIPPASDIGGLRVSVAGTDEAEDAMLDASIPQTATIKRGDSSITVEYNGKPKFEKIKGTEVAYAVNTGAQVLEIDNKYYAVDQGVWYVSDSATGPWAVADTVPEDKIAKIPPSSPVYNVTHVHIYESTPEVVYVGYTPGYMWSFPYYGVPVYGTGWYYPPYWGGGHYYPRPPTWGFNVGYNPWTGWNFGVSWSNGFFSMGMSWGGGWGGNYRPWGCCGGWYGGGYRGPTIINTGDINIGNNINIGNRTNIRNRIDNDKLQIGDRTGGRNLYQRPANRDRLADQGAVSRLKQARPATSRDNNVFAGRDGDVARKVGDNWETRQDGSWSASPKAEAAKEQVAGMSDQQKQQARDKAQSTGAAARDRVSTMDSAQKQQAAQQARDRATQASQRNVRQQSQFNRNDFNRAAQARSMGASREMRRPSGGFRRR